MDGLRDTARRLAHYRRLFGREGAGGLGAGSHGGGAMRSRLVEIDGFGSNPGNVRMLVHQPPWLDKRPALVVALHGCMQTADGFDFSAGWSTLSDRHGFMLLLPEQRQASNSNRCFNWFQPEHTRRDAGEALSIRQMVAHMVARFGVAPERVYVTGLSAGGAMTSTLLATYPDVFAAGAILAGLPHGSAGTLPEALEAMAKSRRRPAHQWGDEVRRASGHKGVWPRVGVWHGTADTIVVPANAEASVAQWLDVHGVAGVPVQEQRLPGANRRTWRNSAGDAVVESYAIDGMGHGVPLALAGAEACGSAGPFAFDVGLSSTILIARSFGVAPKAPAGATSDRRAEPPGQPARPRQPEPGAAARSNDPAGIADAVHTALRKAGLLHGDANAHIDPQAIIESALRSVGLGRKR